MERLEEARNMLVRRWGEMGGYWGINRTMAEIHALLFISREPLCTDEVMERLKISRGNASMNLRGLVDWRLVERVHKLGDRKEYFRADTNVWRMFETITRERRRREVEPLLATLDHCCEMFSPGAAHVPEADEEDTREFRRRVEDLRRFLSNMSALFDSLLHFGEQGVEQLVKLMAGEPDGRPRVSARHQKVLSRNQ